MEFDIFVFFKHKSNFLSDKKNFIEKKDKILFLFKFFKNIILNICYGENNYF